METTADTGILSIYLIYLLSIFPRHSVRAHQYGSIHQIELIIAYQAELKPRPLGYQSNTITAAPPSTNDESGRETY